MSSTPLLKFLKPRRLLLAPKFGRKGRRKITHCQTFFLPSIPKNPRVKSNHMGLDEALPTSLRLCLMQYMKWTGRSENSSITCSKRRTRMGRTIPIPLTTSALKTGVNRLVTLQWWPSAEIYRESEMYGFRLWAQCRGSFDDPSSAQITGLVIVRIWLKIILSLLDHDISGGWCFDYCISRIGYWCFGCLCIGIMLHEMRNRGGYASARSLRSAFTWYKHTGESRNVGDNERYADLGAIQWSAITRSNRSFTYFDDSDNDNLLPLRVEDERRVYRGDDGCNNASWK